MTPLRKLDYCVAVLSEKLLLCRNDILLPFKVYVLVVLYEYEEIGCTDTGGYCRGRIEGWCKDSVKLNLLNYTGRVLTLKELFVYRILKYYSHDLILNQVMSSVQKCGLINSL